MVEKWGSGTGRSGRCRPVGGGGGTLVQAQVEKSMIAMIACLLFEEERGVAKRHTKLADCVYTSDFDITGDAPFLLLL